MNVTELRDRCNKIIFEGKGDARVYVFSDTGGSMDAELNALPAREIELYRPFWSTVEGYIIQ